MAHILVVEDYGPCRRLFEFMLAQGGHTMVFVETSRAALAALIESEVDFDLVLTDLILPDFSGVRLAEALRRDPRFENLPIILATGSVNDEYHESARMVGIEKIMIKPIGSDELLRVIDGVLAAARTEPFDPDAPRKVGTNPLRRLFAAS